MEYLEKVSPPSLSSKFSTNRKIFVTRLQNLLVSNFPIWWTGRMVLLMLLPLSCGTTVCRKCGWILLHLVPEVMLVQDLKTHILPCFSLGCCAGDIRTHKQFSFLMRGTVSPGCSIDLHIWENWHDNKLCHATLTSLRLFWKAYSSW